MIAWGEYKKLTLHEKIQALYEHGTFVMAIRYYGYKVNLYLMGNYYLEVFINHKHALIEKMSTVARMCFIYLLIEFNVIMLKIDVYP